MAAKRFIYIYIHTHCALIYTYICIQLYLYIDISYTYRYHPGPRFPTPPKRTKIRRAIFCFFSVNSETRGSKPRRASAQASHHAPADPVIHEKAPAAANVSKHDEDPFWPFVSVFEDAPPEDEMQEQAPPAAASKDPEDAAKVSSEEDPFWSFW